MVHTVANEVWVVSKVREDRQTERGKQNVPRKVNMNVQWSWSWERERVSECLGKFCAMRAPVFGVTDGQDFLLVN